MLGFAFDALRLGLQTGTMLMHAQQVVAMRTLGMMGGWNLRDGEPARMVAEKMAAFTESSAAIHTALTQSKPPLAVATAALKPYAKRTRSNARSLSRRGPG